MRIGGLAWFIAGFALCMVWMNDGLGGLLSGAVTIVGSLVTFVVELGFMFGVAGALALLGLGLLIGREWSERARGQKDADDAWNRRNAYRK